MNWIYRTFDDEMHPEAAYTQAELRGQSKGNGNAWYEARNGPKTKFWILQITGNDDMEERF